MEQGQLAAMATMLAMQHFLSLCMCMCRDITERLISGNRPGRERGGEQEDVCGWVGGGGAREELRDAKRNRRLNVGTDGEMGDRR